MTMTSSAESNLDYCRRREDEEREAAASTKCPQAQDVHFQMAERYADLAWSIEESTDAAYRPSSLWQAIAAKLDVLSPANDAEPLVRTTCCATTTANTMVVKSGEASKSPSKIE